MESFYPLHVFVCDQCFLVQLEEFVSPEKIFTEYAYFSAYSDSWLEHCAALYRADDRALSPERQEPGGRTGQQRRLSAAVLREEQRSGAGH